LRPLFARRRAVSLAWSLARVLVVDMVEELLLMLLLPLCCRHHALARRPCRIGIRRRLGCGDGAVASWGPTWLGDLLTGHSRMWMEAGRTCMHV
jgi:hypothetical protein